MSHFIEGLDRHQTMLLPEHLDDYGVCSGWGQDDTSRQTFDKDFILKASG